jgi:hypothetical protein
VFAFGTLTTFVEVFGEFVYPNYVGLMPGLIIFEFVQLLPAIIAVVLLRTPEATGYYRELEEKRALPPRTRRRRTRRGARGRA